MSVPNGVRRAETELDAAAVQSGCSGIGNRSIHQFWHLFAAHYRGVLLAPRRRPDNSNVAWSWRESSHDGPATSAELTELRHRLAHAGRSMNGGFPEEEDGQSLESQVRIRVARMTADLIALPDRALAGYTCRTEHGFMLHSWGAAFPAQPIYPDGQPSGISGRVLAGESEPAGVVVFLENLSGGATARVRTDRVGVFQFPNVAPGKYRLRVVDRPEFSAEGLVVEIERAALTGLELRAAPAKQANATAVRTPARTSHRRAGAAGLLAFLVAGFGLWHYTHPGAVVATSRMPITGWQTATGHLSATSSDTESVEAKPAGGSGGWSELSHHHPDPRLPGSHHSARNTAQAVERTATQNEVEGMPATQQMKPDPTANGAEPANRVSMEPVRAEMTTGKTEVVAGSPDQQSAEFAGATAHDTVTGDKEVAASLTGRNSSTQKATEPGHEPPPPIASRRPPSAETSAEPTTGGAILHGESTSSAPSAAGPASQPERLRQSGGRGGSGDAKADTGVDAGAAGGSMSPGGSGRGAAGTDHLRAGPGSPQAERTGATKGGGTTVLSSFKTAKADPALQAGTVVAELPDDQASFGPRSDDHRTPVRTSGDPRQFSTEDSGADDPARVSATPFTSPAGTESPAAGLAAAMEPGPDRMTIPPTDEAGPQRALRPLGRLVNAAWKLQMVRDAIIPTLPMPAGRKESLEEMRERLRTLQREQLPATFQNPAIWQGIILESAQAGPDELHWRAVAGAVPPGATVRGNRAELAWPAPSRPRGTEYVLENHRGRELARVSIAESGAVTVQGAKEVRGWHWAGIESVESECSGSKGPRFVWRLLSGAALPPEWQLETGWRDGRGQRLLMPLPRDLAATPDGRLALTDSLTGWAMTCEIGAP